MMMKINKLIPIVIIEFVKFTCYFMEFNGSK